MIRTKPNSPVNFDVHEEGIVKLFNEFDRYQLRATTGLATPDEAFVYRLAELEEEGTYQTANFQLVSALVQMPHLDVVEQIEKRKGSPLTATERRHLDQRIASARVWVENYASDSEKTRLQETLPARAEELSQAQRAFLRQLADALPQTPWEDEALQSKIFEVARMTPLDQPLAFKALYRVLLDKDAGPKAGNLLAFLELPFLLRRFQELPLDEVAFWRESAVSEEVLAQWIAKQGDKLESKTWETRMSGALAIFEITYLFKDGKRQLKRLLLEGGNPDVDSQNLLARLA
jgi:lysyl-tRNA synthetase class 1